MLSANRGHMTFAGAERQRSRGKFCRQPVGSGAEAFIGEKGYPDHGSSQTVSCRARGGQAVLTQGFPARRAVLAGSFGRGVGSGP